MPKTYNELYIDLRNRLRGAGVEAATLEAGLLVAHAAGKPYAKLMADLRLYTSPEVEARTEELAQRRLNGEPAAYITGSWGFCGLDLKVDENVLIPRSDTEVLVETALNLSGKSDSELRILDLCTGSGCIGLALARFLPNSHAVLADVSPDALRVAKENIRRCGLGVRAVTIEADALAPPPPRLGSFDLITCNPPYIPTAEIGTLDASVRDHEPRLALDGGEDGLDFYRRIAEESAEHLSENGVLLTEIGFDQGESVPAIFGKNAAVRLFRDDNGKPRVVAAEPAKGGANG